MWRYSFHVPGIALKSIGTSAFQPIRTRHAEHSSRLRPRHTGLIRIYLSNLFNKLNLFFLSGKLTVLWGYFGVSVSIVMRYVCCSWRLLGLLIWIVIKIKDTSSFLVISCLKSCFFKIGYVILFQLLKEDLLTGLAVI